MEKGKGSTLAIYAGIGVFAVGALCYMLNAFFKESAERRIQEQNFEQCYTEVTDLAKSNDWYSPTDPNKMNPGSILAACYEDKTAAQKRDYNKVYLNLEAKLIQ